MNTNNTVQRLVNIYNGLLNISTKGEETLIMADCMREFLAVIQEFSSNMKLEDNKEE